MTAGCTGWVAGLLQDGLLTALVLLLAPVVGLLIMGFDRRVTARVQGRYGPPILQPFYDVAKLFRKEPLILNRVQVFYAYLHLAFILMTIILLVHGQDLLLILFAHAFSTIALILGGMSVRSPYSRIGSQRRIMQMVAYEPILILLVVGIYLQNGSFMASEILRMDRSLFSALPLLFLSFLGVLAIKMEKSPFDVATSHHAHQELVKGITLEYSGPYLALLEIAHACEVTALFAVVVAFWANNPVVGLVLDAGVFLALILVDNVCARLTTNWMVRAMWTVPMILAIGNLLWIYGR